MPFVSQHHHIMNSFWINVLLLHVIGFSFLVNGGAVIKSPRTTNFGIWGKWAYCPPGQYVFAMQLKTERLGSGENKGDDTALNGIKLFCARKDGTRNYNTFITSTVGPWGQWLDKYTCKTGFSKGFQLRSEVERGVGLDDTAANNLKLLCSTGEVLVGDGRSWGDWTTTQNCPSTEYICGIRTQIEPRQGTGINGDDTSMNNVDMQCCTF